MIAKNALPLILIFAGIIALLCFMSGCASYSQELRNSTGQTQSCQSEGWGIAGTLSADTMQKRCLAKLHAAGYN